METGPGSTYGLTFPIRVHASQTTASANSAAAGGSRYAATALTPVDRALGSLSPPLPRLLSVTPGFDADRCIRRFQRQAFPDLPRMLCELRG